MIDGFGTCLYGTEGQTDWFQRLYFDDLGASILRFDLTPRFRSPISDHAYNSPSNGGDPFPGPDGNNVRTYTGPSDYQRPFSSRISPIAVMGPDIDRNVEWFDYDDPVAKTAGTMARRGKEKRDALGDFKLMGSLWSPAPWLKRSSGRHIEGEKGNKPRDGTPWPFVWAGNYAGGCLDTSGTPLPALDDSAVGGHGPTSAVEQLARGFAAYLRGFQRTFGVDLYAVSLQNELVFETFYNSCSYPTSAGYVVVLKAVRAELDKYPDLAPIKITGPEDLLGGDAFGLWQYGGRGQIVHKNLQFLQNVFADPVAARALDFACVHGYASDGVSSSGAKAQTWAWWANGWSERPARGLPAQVQGFATLGKKSWMTETSGEDLAWLSPEAGFPSDGAFSIALKIHQALTTGLESAWLYWQTSDGKPRSSQTLTDADERERAPKYLAAKHFFRFIRPNAQRADTTVSGSSGLVASAYVHDRDGTLTVVVVNPTPAPIDAVVEVPSLPRDLGAFEVTTSSKDAYWLSTKAEAQAGRVSVVAPGYGVVTLVGHGAPVSAADLDAVPRAPAPKSGASGCGCRRPARTSAMGIPILAGLYALASRRRRRR